MSSLCVLRGFNESHSIVLHVITEMCFFHFLFIFILPFLTFFCLFSESSSSSSGSDSENDEKRPVFSNEFKQDSLVEGTSSRYSMYNSVSQKLMVGQNRFGPCRIITLIIEVLLLLSSSAILLYVRLETSWKGRQL